MSYCKDCGREIDWMQTAEGRYIPVDPDPEFVIEGDGDESFYTEEEGIRKAYTDCKWNGPARTAMNPSQEVEAAMKRVEAGFSTAAEETAQLTGGDYNRNIRQRLLEAERKREVEEAGTPPQLRELPPGGGQEQEEGNQNG